MSVVERTCPLLLSGIDGDNTPKMDELSKKLESGNDNEKIEALKEIIHCVITGIEMSRLTMQVIKFCLRSRDHRIKKLLQIYWEVLDKKYPNSDKLKPEIILVCNHLLNDLKHPNEYIRGSTCRLLCRISEPEILEQLVPQVLANLEHRNSYVRKNAVLALMRIYALHNELVPDAPQRVYEFLMKEGNPLAKRNAFLMLANCDLRNALDFFLTVNDKIGSYSETMQTSILELMRKVCRQLPVPKSIFVKCAAYLLDSSSNAVVYEAANTLLSLTPLDSAINRALEAYARLLQSESDQNIKIVVINRLDSLKRRYDRNLRFVLMDILRALSTPNLDIRTKILALVLELSSPQNIEDIIGVLKKELVSANAEADPQITLYRGKLVETMHQCAVKFPQVAPQVVHLLMNHLDANVIMFVKEMLQDYHDLQESILQKLLENFAEISDEMVSRTALWIIGEYAQTKELIATSIDAIMRALGDLPLHTNESNEEEGKCKSNLLII
ncbi:coatomer protein complex, subunit beta 1 [Reticulomyxa filosa]|uniref:Coatomer protein complex, subunit beta 1 n=1 Tax=Reticulomyxa filosa TaxID=46433 RepID=X6NG64_RETFI|nr:coatomer protein complex, subunit beta 1 [Reticulomyxa filosa]|eukprot:ETO25320.1 coatomer protein complex, subunit beta 1 [Reticulomyxa filosa]